jgi:hypothetical protein
MQKREYISISSLELYHKCPRLFSKRYIEQAPAREVIQEPLILGSLAHSLLESKLKDDLTVPDALALMLPTWVESLCGIPLTNSFIKMKEGAGINLESLYNYADKVSDLLIRAAPNYHKDDRIRKTNGEPIKDPFSKYTAKSWLAEYKKLKLDTEKFYIDLVCCKQNPDFRNFSLSNTAAWSTYMAKNFRRESGMTTLDVEWQFGPDVNRIVTIEGYPLKGAIDWVVELDTGEIAIIDHKTSKKHFKDIEVSHHKQLNLYAYVYGEVTGKLPDWIVISAPYSRRFYWQPVSIDNVYEAVQYVKNSILCINSNFDSNTWSAPHPNDYNSPCISRNWETGLVTYECPFLESCWPTYSQDLTTFEPI